VGDVLVILEFEFNFFNFICKRLISEDFVFRLLTINCLFILDLVTLYNLGVVSFIMSYIDLKVMHLSNLIMIVMFSYQ
jgi:hypothetical protein